MNLANLFVSYCEYAVGKRKKFEIKACDGEGNPYDGVRMANQSQFVRLLPILHGILSCATVQEYNDPELQVAGMEMIGVCATPAPSFDKRVRQVAEYLEIDSWDVHVVRKIRAGHPNPIDYYYIGKKEFKEITEG